MKQHAYLICDRIVDDSPSHINIVTPILYFLFKARKESAIIFSDRWGTSEYYLLNVGRRTFDNVCLFFLPNLTSPYQQDQCNWIYHWCILCLSLKYITVFNLFAEIDSGMLVFTGVLLLKALVAKL